MSTKTKTRAQEIGLEIKKLNDEVCSIHDQVDEKQSGKHTDEQKKLVIEKNQRIEELEKEFQDTEEWRKSQESAEVRRDALSRFKGGERLSPSLLADIMGANSKTIGDSVMDDEKFKAWWEENSAGGSRPFSPGIKSPAVQVKTLLTGASSTSGGALVVNDRKPIIDRGTFYRELTFMDIIGRGVTGSDTVEYVREGTHTNAAAAVAEATGTGDGTGNKPESAMALSVVTENVRNIAHWIPATNRALADAGQLRTLIDMFLIYGLQEELEDLMITGSGTGENFTGVLNVSGTTAQAFDTDILTTTRRARTKVKVTGKARPTAYVMHPNDWEDIDLMQDNEGRYFYGGPSAIGNPRLWGLPVVECEGMTEGTSMVAPWNLAVLWDREQSSIAVSDSHSDFFTRNLVAIRAEQRAAFGVLRPAAFVEIDLTA